MPLPIQFLLNGVDVTSSVYEAVIEKQEKRGADSCQLLVSKNLSVDIGHDLKVKDIVGNRFVFGGKVVEIGSEYTVRNVTCLSYGKVLDEIRIFPSLSYVSKTPEFIVQDLITKFTDFSFSGASSGVTLNRYEASGYLIDSIRTLATSAGFDFWTGVTTAGAKVFYFRPANTNLNKTLYLGKVGSNLPNAIRDSYEVDDSLLFNAVEVYGRGKTESVRYVFEQLDSFTDYYFPRVLYSLSLSLRNVALTEGVEYRYDIEERKVKLLSIYTSSSTNPARLEFSYMADNTPLIYKENSSSVSTYGRRVAAVVVENESEISDLNVFADKFLNVYSQPRKSLVVIVPGLDFDYTDGGYVTVYDPYLGINGQTFVVRSVKWVYPKGETVLTLGEFVTELYDLQRRTRFEVEKSAKSYIQARDKRLLEKKFFFSGTGISDNGLVEDVSQVGPTYTGLFVTTASPVWFRLRLIFFGEDDKEFNAYNVAPIYVPTKHSDYRPYYSQSLILTPSDIIDASYMATPHIFMRAQVYGMTSYSSSATQTIVAPDSYDPSRYFQTYVYGVSQTVPCTIGMILYVAYDDYINAYRVAWGQYPVSALSGIYGVGFKSA